MAKEKKAGLSKLIFTALGAAVSLFAAKKIVDIYAQYEDENEDLITEEEYLEKLKNEESEYVRKSGPYGETFFDFSKIENQAKADMLFRQFLKKVDQVSEKPDKIFKIMDLEKLIPYEESGMDSRSSYNYSVMSMLGGQASRDYFIFLGYEDLRDIFTQEANDINRDNSYWKEFKDERFKINHKYIWPRPGEKIC